MSHAWERLAMEWPSSASHDEGLQVRTRAGDAEESGESPVRPLAAVYGSTMVRFAWLALAGLALIGLTMAKGPRPSFMQDRTPGVLTSHIVMQRFEASAGEGTCGDITDPVECASTSGCTIGEVRDENGDLPEDTSTGELLCRDSETIDCSMDANDDAKRLMFFSSTGIDTPEGKFAFRELVMQLPDTAWEGDGVGAAAKKQAKEASAADVLANGFSEPYLFAGLDVLLIEDACLLKEAFWNPDNEDFNTPDGDSLNYQKMGWDSNDIAAKHWGKLDGGWCSDMKTVFWGGFGGLGFDDDRFEEVSFFGQSATKAMQEALFNLQASTDTSADSPQAIAFDEALETCQSDETTIGALGELMGKLESADIVAFNGGNPDFITWALMKYHPAVAETLDRRIKEGSVVYVSRSAGSMVGSADMGLSYEPNDVLFEHLLGGSSEAIGLAGKCAIRPHYTSVWAMASAIYAQKKDLNVIRLPNSEAMSCQGTNCKVVGNTCKQGDPLFPEGGDPNMEHLDRLADAMEVDRTPWTP